MSKLGRSFTRSKDHDVMGTTVKFVQTPEGKSFLILGGNSYP